MTDDARAAQFFNVLEYEFRTGDHDDTEFDCCLPGRCCMSGPHMRCECHTAEMVEAYEHEEDYR